MSRNPARNRALTGDYRFSAKKDWSFSNAADDDLERLGQQHLRQVEGVEPEGGFQPREAQLVGGVGVLAARGGVVVDRLHDVDVGDPCLLPLLRGAGDVAGDQRLGAARLRRALPVDRLRRADRRVRREVASRGSKVLRHSLVGDLTLDWDALACVGDPDQQLVVWAAEPGTPLPRRPAHPVLLGRARRPRRAPGTARPVSLTRLSAGFPGPTAAAASPSSPAWSSE
ncbi:MmyB family transcriptional regulator [Streptomyces sp. NPDC001091]